MIFNCPNCKNSFALVRARRVKPRDVSCPGCEDVLISNCNLVGPHQVTDNTARTEKAHQREKKLVLELDF